MGIDRSVSILLYVLTVFLLSSLREAENSLRKKGNSEAFEG